MDIDGNAVAGMIFSLLCLLVIGGFILMFPLTRRLGALMEQRLQDRKESTPEGRAGSAGGSGADGAGPSSTDLKELRVALESLENEVGRLGERQQFIEKLLESSAAPKELSPP